MQGKVAIVGAPSAATLAALAATMPGVEIVVVESDPLETCDQLERELDASMERLRQWNTGPEVMVACRAEPEVELPYFHLEPRQRDYPHTAGQLRRAERARGRGRRR